MAATLDQISGGRLDLGWGSVPDELAAFGFGCAPARVRAHRLQETLEILKLLFTGKQVSYQGEYFELDGAVANPRPVQDAMSFRWWWGRNAVQGSRLHPEVY